MRSKPLETVNSYTLLFVLPVIKNLVPSVLKSKPYASTHWEPPGSFDVIAVLAVWLTELKL